MKGYKGFNSDLTCLNFQYEIGKEYSCKRITLCSCGFHFCEKLSDCFGYYSDEYTRFCEIEAVGKIKSDGVKFVTDKIRIVRELSPEEIILEAMHASSEESLNYLSESIHLQNNAVVSDIDRCIASIEDYTELLKFNDVLLAVVKNHNCSSETISKIYSLFESYMPKNQMLFCISSFLSNHNTPETIILDFIDKFDSKGSDMIDFLSNHPEMKTARKKISDYWKMEVKTSCHNDNLISVVKSPFIPNGIKKVIFENHKKNLVKMRKAHSVNYFYDIRLNVISECIKHMKLQENFIMSLFSKGEPHVQIIEAIGQSRFISEKLLNDLVEKLKDSYGRHFLLTNFNFSEASIRNYVNSNELGMDDVISLMMNINTPDDILETFRKYFSSDHITTHFDFDARLSSVTEKHFENLWDDIIKNPKKYNSDFVVLYMFSKSMTKKFFEKYKKVFRHVEKRVMNDFIDRVAEFKGWKI